ncbi:MAG: phosphatidylserine decarboxylase [Simkaniaceae bacterium]|nr:phosphatidylserine decarboxylase [Simkaniaceae bacterium]
MTKINFINRETKQVETEKVYGQYLLEVFYGKGFVSKIISWTALPLLTRFSFLSKIYGFFQKTKKSQKKIAPFIRDFKVDTSEFETQQFDSFNDFFTRKLKKTARPIDKSSLVLPADGRYLAYSSLKPEDKVAIKGQSFTLESLLQCKSLAKKYAGSSLLIARLCPVDYHRFHFPADCTPSRPTLIKGQYNSVNPIALAKNLSYLSQNKRIYTTLLTKNAGDILYMEIGATNVSSIQQTFAPNKPYLAGEEKGYFEFGGSCLVLLFEKGRVEFASDLLEATAKGYEMYAKMGSYLGKICK